MSEANKICPQCAEEIKAEARLCRYCGATFTITTQGYCPICHEVRGADSNGNCTQCGTALADLHIDSQLAPVVAASVQGVGSSGPVSGTQQTTTPAKSPPIISSTPPPSAAQARSPKKRKLWLVFLAVGIIALAMYLIMDKNIFSALPTSLSPSISQPTSTPRRTATPSPSPTPQPSATPLPASTSTPAPVDVTFDSIGNYDAGRLVTLIGRLVLTSNINCRGTECGLLLENPSDTSQKITIFITAGDEPNQLKPVPETYKKGDIKVRLDDGTYALIGYRLRVTGRVCETTDGDACISSIRKVELYQVK